MNEAYPRFSAVGKILLLLLAAILLTACDPTETVSVASPAPTEQPVPTDEPMLTMPPVETVTLFGQTYEADATALVLPCQSAEELSDALSRFPKLQSLTLSQLALTPDELLSIRTNYPDLDLVCDVDLNGQRVPQNSTVLDLSGVPDADPTVLLSVFPALRELQLGELSPLAAQSLLEQYGQLNVSYRFRGQTVSAKTEQFDLTGEKLPALDELNALFSTAPNLKRLTIDEPDEAARAVLCAFNPREKGVVLSGTLTLFDLPFEADAEIFDFGTRKLSDEEAMQLESVLPLFTNLKEIDLYESSLSQETMDTLFDAHPDLFFGWTFTIWDGFYTVRSDATAFSSKIGLPGSHRWLLTEDDFRNLRYCRNLMALDLGHCGIKNIEFLRNWPHMRILILADTCVTDLSVLAELSELEYIELFLTSPDSYEPLTHLPNLIDLNLGHTKKADGQYRDDDEIRLLLTITSLERLWINKTLTEEQAQILREGLPGVEFDFSSYGSTDKGWREHPRFFILRKIFNTRTYVPFS